MCSALFFVCLFVFCDFSIVFIAANIKQCWSQQFPIDLPRQLLTSLCHPTRVTCLCTGCLTFLLGNFYCDIILSWRLCLDLLFLVHGPSQKDCSLYAALFPFFILFISLSKYVNTVTVMCCLTSWCRFIAKRNEMLCRFTANLLKG